MPRATRAALRAQELAEEATTAASIALPPTPTKERVPLGEISSNSPAKVDMVVENSFDADQKPAKGKKGKGAKKGKKGAKAKAGTESVEVLEDDNLSSHSDAAEQACGDLTENNANRVASPEEIILPDHIDAPSSPAVEMATKQLSPSVPSETVTEPRVVMSAGTDQSINKEHADSSMAHHVDEASKTLDMDEKKVNEDSFVEQIKSRSPAKRVSRIEDSVEALDALEDEIEKVGEAIPATTSDLSSPTDARKQTKANPSLALKTTQAPKDKGKGCKTPIGRAAAPSKTNPVSLKPTTRPSTVGSKRQVSQKPVSMSGSATNIQDPSTTPAKRETRAAKRVSSLHNAPFVPTKSSKPPTTSTFELPGEAVARKLKEQRDERRKREEEEQTKKSRQLKAKPVQRNQAPEVKLTATARARLSMAQNNPNGQAKSSLATGTPRAPADAAPKRQSVSAPARNSSLQLAKRAVAAPANTSAKRGPSLGMRTLSRQRSSLSQPRPAPSAEELSQQKTRGKEVYGRNRQMLSEQETEKKTKEEAAKKARIEAAERGRAASREWAEKQKARKMAAQKAKSEGVSEVQRYS